MSKVAGTLAPMKRVWMGLAAAAVLAAGCGKSETEGGTTPSPTGSPTASGEIKGDVELAAFKGGYGIDFFEKVGKEFEAKHPGVKVKVEGDPRIWEKLRPRFIGDNPPDLAFPGWGMDHWALKQEGQLMELDEALKGKPAEGEGTWGDTFEPALLKIGQQDGKQWVLPYFFSVLGWWYDPGFFKEKGWTPPKTWDELLALGEKIKAAGVAPITFQGKYPYYMIDGMLMPWVCSIGGPEAVLACQNMEPGAWKSEPVLRAASMIDELNKKGFFQRGAVGMSHTESEQEFLNRRAAMVPCGTWLKAEMKDSMPKGAQIEFLMPPVVAGGKGDPSALIIKIEPWMVPSKAKNPTAAIELFKELTSLTNAKKFVQEKGTLMAIKGSDQVEMMPELKAPAEAFRSSKYVYSLDFRDWYQAFSKEVENSLTSLLNGQDTPQTFCDRIEKAAEALRNDGSIMKHKKE